MASIFNVAAAKIGELLVKEAKFLYGVEDQVRSLQKDLIMMSSFLIDMEAIDEEVRDERSRATIKEIRTIAYEAEDVIESYILEACGKKDLFKRYLCSCSSLPHTHQIGSKIADIKSRIVETMNRCKTFVGEYGLRTDLRLGLSKKKARVTYSHTFEGHVVGLDEDIKKLVGVLTTNEHTKIKVVSIVGMGGSGKTTLARKLFNHEDVKKHFDCVAWVSVSQQWVAQQILLDLLKKFSRETMRMDKSSYGHQGLVEKVYGRLEGKGYLIVLDDVWEEKALDDILPALPLESDGMKIIVTTRNKKVVDYPNLRPLTYPHEPRRLKDNESWELFRKIAVFHKEEETSNSTDIAKLEALGKEMLQKCKGLPLAVIALAGILSGKKTLEEWEQISKAVSSRIMKDGKGTHLYGPVNQMLALSFSDLPLELKPCFLYLARYPEDYKIHVGRLIRMWIAEGFLTTAELHEGETIEDVARRYLDDLLQRCMVQVASRGGYDGEVKIIQMHDIVRDLCITKAKEADFMENFSYKSQNSDANATKFRRAAILSSVKDDISLPIKSQHLRSLEFTVEKSFGEEKILSLQVIHERFKLLRVLLLENITIPHQVLPTGIGSLIHLKYLGLFNTNITRLPSSVENLRNLLILESRNTLTNLRIPNVLWKIESLRHVYFNHYMVEYRKRLNFHTLKYLQTLKGVSGGRSWMLKELPRLSSTVQKLDIRDMRSQAEVEAALQCPSIRQDNLHSLTLQWFVKQGVKLENILKPILHSQHLWKLDLIGRIGSDGLSNTQFPSSIKKLTLRMTKLEAEATLVGLGKLPQLTILRLYDMAYMGTRWSCTAGDFPQLKELMLRRLKNLEEWSIELGAMPQLKNLEMKSCTQLKRIPEGLKFITTLQELTILYMSGEFCERIKGEGEDAHIIQHIPVMKTY